VVQEVAEALRRPDDALLCLDSDALLFQAPKFNPGCSIELATCRRTGPQYTWFRDLSILKRFCSFIQESFTDPSLSAKLDSFYETKASPLAFHGGNVCDMHLLGLFSLQLGPHYRNLETVGDDFGIRYDNNLNDLDGYVGEHGTAGPKRILWGGRLPHGMRDGKLIPLGGLHFQGGLKKRMVEYLTVRKTPREIALVLVRKIFRTAKRLAQGGS
jgi:hypothetical protein